MSIHALIKDGVVANVIVIGDSDDPVDLASVYGVDLAMDVTDWTPSAPGPSWVWNGERFYPPQPFPSWTLDEDFNWQPPTARPESGGPFAWDEDTLSWVDLSQ